MTDVQRRQMTEEEVEKLLPDGNRIHVFLMEGDEILSQDWTRATVLARVKSCGAEVGGKNAKEAQHGIVSVGPTDIAYIQNRVEARS